MTGSQAPAPCTRDDSGSCGKSGVIPAGVFCFLRTVIGFEVRKVDRHQIIGDFPLFFFFFKKPIIVYMQC